MQTTYYVLENLYPLIQVDLQEHITKRLLPGISVLFYLEFLLKEILKSYNYLKHKILFQKWQQLSHSLFFECLNHILQLLEVRLILSSLNRHHLKNKRQIQFQQTTNLDLHGLVSNNMNFLFQVNLMK